MRAAWFFAAEDFLAEVVAANSFDSAGFGAAIFDAAAFSAAGFEILVEFAAARRAAFFTGLFLDSLFGM
jgi:hypothetical protein